jgi:hypothetical protein
MDEKFMDEKFINELICHPERSLPRFFAANGVEGSAVAFNELLTHLTSCLW